MKIQKMLAAATTVLFVSLVVQISLRFKSGPGPQTFAEWKDVPKTAEAATKLADEVVQGQVTNVRRADDLVTKVDGEPNNEDRIPVEVVTIRVEKNYKGRAQTIELFHMVGTPSPASRQEPPESEAPPKPQGGVPKSKRPPFKGDTRTFMLHDDPEYKVGEKYMLFVRKGPKLTVGGAAVETHAIISPTTRFRVSANNKLESMTGFGFAPQFGGKGLRALEEKIPRQ